MGKMMIKAAFVSKVDWLEHHITHTTLPMQATQYEMIMGNDTSKEKMASLFGDCLHFDLVSNTDENGDDGVAEVIFTLRKTQREIDDLTEKFEADRLYGITCCIDRLRTWADNSAENRKQIETLLERRDLTWVLDRMEAPGRDDTIVGRHLRKDLITKPKRKYKC